MFLSLSSKLTRKLDAGMHTGREGFSALPFYDNFDLSSVDILLISQYVDRSPLPQHLLSSISIGQFSQGRIIVKCGSLLRFLWRYAHNPAVSKPCLYLEYISKYNFFLTSVLCSCPLLFSSYALSPVIHARTPVLILP